MKLIVYTRHYCLLLLCFATLLQLKAQTRLPADPGLHYGRLQNGFTYYIQPSNAEPGKIRIELLVKTGIVYEPPHQQNVSHLLEHMGLRSLENFPRGVFEFTSAAGLSRGGDVNASTGGLFTRYYFTIPAGQPKLLQDVLSITRSQAAGMLLVDKEVEQEKNAVIAESKTGDISFDAHYETQRKVFNHPRYPFDLASIIEDVSHLSKSDVEQFYKKWYRPDLQAITVTGSFDTTMMINLVKEIFGTIPPATTPAPPSYADNEFRIRLDGRNHIYTISKPGLSGITINMFKKISAKGINPLATIEDYRSKIIDDLYNEMIQYRLAALQQQYNIPYESFSHSAERNAHETSGMDLAATQLTVSSPEYLEAGFKRALAVLEQIRKNGFTPEEYKHAQLALLNGRSPSHFGLLNTRLINHFHYQAPVISESTEHSTMQSILREDLLQEVNRMAKEWLNDSRDFDIVFVVSDKEAAQLPDEQKVRTWIKQAKTNGLPAFRLATTPVTLMKPAGIPPPGKAAAVQQIASIGATELTLANGIKVVLRPGSTDVLSAGKMKIVAEAPVDPEHYPTTPQQKTALQCAGQILMNCGIGGYNKFEVQNFWKGKDIDFGIGSSQHTKTLYGSTTTVNLEALLQTMYLFLTHPQEDQRGFEDWHIKMQKQLVAQQENIYGKFEDSVHAFYSIHKTTDLSLADLQTVTLNDAFDSYKRVIVNEKFPVFIVTGEFNPADVQPLLVQYLGALDFHPSNRTYQPETETISWPKAPAQMIMRQGHETKAEVRLYFPGYYNKTLINDIKLSFVGQVLQIKMMERLREKDGLVYGANAGAMKQGKNTYAFYISTSCGADLVEKLVHSAQDEFIQLKEHGINKALFELVISQLTNTGFEYALGRSDFWSNHLKNTYLTGEDPTEILKAKSIIQDIITLDDINKAMKQYMSADLMQQFLWLPESN